MLSDNEYHHRTELLLGENAVETLRRTRVIIFGLGGVGSWCAEALARSGIGHLTLVDADRVAPSNLNRQLMTTTANIGLPKPDALAARLQEVAPNVSLELRFERYTPEGAGLFPLDSFDFAIDAIDSVRDKAALILNALATPNLTLFSSMGAARKIDPFRVRQTEFGKVAGDGLARALRHHFKKLGVFPSRKFTCVWSDEPPLDNLGEQLPEENANGSLAHITGTFGLALAGLVIRELNHHS